MCKFGFFCFQYFCRQIDFAQFAWKHVVRNAHSVTGEPDSIDTRSLKTIVFNATNITALTGPYGFYSSKHVERILFIYAVGFIFGFIFSLRSFVSRLARTSLHPFPMRVRDNRRGRKKTTRRAKKYAPIQSVLAPLCSLVPDHVCVSSGEERKRKLTAYNLYYIK